MALIQHFKSNGASGFGYASTAEQVTEGLDLTGKTYLVTGCNSGLGQETSRVLSLRGATVIGTARTIDKATAACADLERALPVACELSEPASVRACVEDVARLGHRLDGVICNAGIMNLPKLERKHGLELQFLTNHLGHFALVNGLIGRLADDARVVVVSSAYHDDKAPGSGIEFDNLDGARSYQGWIAYGQSKLANVLFTRSLAKRLKKGQTANSLHPGIINTNLARYMNPMIKIPLTIGSYLFLKNAEQGAATQTFVATHPSLQGVTGTYFSDCNVARESDQARSDELAEQLWATSERLLRQIEAATAERKVA